MAIGMVNWSGNGNLGDDAMAEILMQEFPYAVNMGVRPQEAELYILGGGTLISNGSAFLQMTPPEKTIMISVGVSYGWDGRRAEEMKRMIKIYTRDYFSHRRLLEFGVENTLSVDLLCYLTPRNRKRHKSMVNLIKTPFYDPKEVEGDEYFAMSRNEDLDAMEEVDVTLYRNAHNLLNNMAAAKWIYATRLHACVLAWVSGCKDIRYDAYDQKIGHFMERVAGITPTDARNIIKRHLKEIQDIIYKNE